MESQVELEENENILISDTVKFMTPLTTQTYSFL